MNEKPFISVIIPVYNGALYLRDALDSIRRQGYPFLEVIVVDDGSTDNSKEIARSFPLDIRYFFQAHLGPAVARNRGIKEAKGEIIAFLDSDDVWPDNKLKIQVAYLQCNPQVQAIYGRVQFMVASLRENDNVSFEALREPVLGVNLGSALFRKRVFESFGMFDPELVSSEDVDLLLRLKELEVPIMQSEEVGLYYRLHADNFTRDKTMRNREFIHALKRSLDRRQKKGKS